MLTPLQYRKIGEYLHRSYGNVRFRIDCIDVIEGKTLVVVKIMWGTAKGARVGIPSSVLTVGGSEGGSPSPSPPSREGG